MQGSHGRDMLGTFEQQCGDQNGCSRVMVGEGVRHEDRQTAASETLGKECPSELGAAGGAK